MADADVLLENRMWYLEVIAVFGVHFDTVDELVTVGEVLLGEALLEGHSVILPDLRRVR